MLANYWEIESVYNMMHFCFTIVLFVLWKVYIIIMKTDLLCILLSVFIVYSHVPLFLVPCLQGIWSVICFASQTQSSIAVYVISKLFSWIFNEAVAFCSARCMCNRCVALLDRNEVTKLKFEGKTFHIYANQKEVRAWIVGCWIRVCMFWWHWL